MMRNMPGGPPNHRLQRTPRGGEQDRCDFEAWILPSTRTDLPVRRR
jgi:hypothetical protein